MGIKILLGVMLGICSITDIHKKKIPLKLIGITSIILLILFPFHTEMLWYDRILGGMLGLFLLGVSKITKGQIGFGDGLVFFVTGIGVGLWSNLWLFIYSILLAFIYAAICWIRDRKNRKQEIPFVPFIFLAYIGVIVGC